MVLLSFVVVFEDMDNPGEFYDSRENSREKLDERFEEMVLDHLDEKCEVDDCYSETGYPTHAVFRAEFKRTNQQLYEDFGRGGMSTVVGTAAEGVYGQSVDQVRMEEW